MNDSATKATVRRAGQSTAIVDVGGEVTGDAERSLGAAFTEAAGDGTNTIILNFSSLEYMNSGGIGLLVTLLIRANRGGKRLLACGLDEHYRQIFTLTRLDEAIACFDDEAAALVAAN